MQKTMGDDDPYKLNAKQFGSSMSQIAHAQVMQAAARDYKKELLANEKQVHATQHEAFDVRELMKDDEDLHKIHADRIAELQDEKERRAQKLHKGHGTVTEIVEAEFLEIVTKTAEVVCHFCHRDFERCKLMDKHLAILAAKYFDTRFIKMPAQDSPFFTVKLDIKVLPCVVVFRDGVSVDRVVGFDGLGAKDDFETKALEMRLLECGAIQPIVSTEDPENAGHNAGSKLRKGFSNFAKTASDEDSDFDD